MNDNIVIQVINLGKRFKIYSNPWLRTLEWVSYGRKTWHQDFWALKDISFEVKRGECLGIIGPNGAGKSTLLKILTRSLHPTTGTFQIRGRVLSLLELGTGFNPELTGRQNIYRSSQLLGFPERHVSEHIQNIQKFAEIGEFFDRPIKIYSAGMYIRLAFSMFVFLRPEVLIVDEVLSVGDLRFQKKCKEKMNELKSQGVTILLASHIMSDISTMCKNALFLNRGQMVLYGSASEAINAYTYAQGLTEMKNFEARPNIDKDANPIPTEYGGDKGGTREIIISNVSCYQKGKDKNVPEICFGENIMIEFDYEALNKIESPIFRINFSVTGYNFLANIDSTDTGLHIPFIEGKGRVLVEIKDPNLYPQAYKVNIGVVTETLNTHLFFWNEAASFIVRPPDGICMCYPTAIVKLKSEILLLQSEPGERSGKKVETSSPSTLRAFQAPNPEDIERHKPFMNDIEIQAMVCSLQLFHKPIQALEWGSGNSTIYFSAHLPVRSEWTSVEHNAEWADQTKTMISEYGNEKIQLYYVPNTDKWLAGMSDGNYDTFRDYVLFPTTLNKKFQFILVDGRARVECMQIGWMLLEDFGIMILHDAQRTQYNRGIPPDCFFLRVTNPSLEVDGNIGLLFMSKSSYVINLLSGVLRKKLPDYMQFEFDDYTSSNRNMRMSWVKLERLPSIRLYAGDIPDFVEYEGLVGLSLNINDFRHIQHDIRQRFLLADDSVDSFQVEDVFEHIPYDQLIPIINEIYRVLKPGGSFRLSLPDYGCDVLQNRSVKGCAGTIVFDPGGGGVPEKPGHVWFPRIDNVKALLEKTHFSKYGLVHYLQYYHLDGTFVVREVDYSKGYIQRTPDFDVRAMAPYRPMSLIIDLQKASTLTSTNRSSADTLASQTEIEFEGTTKDKSSGNGDKRKGGQRSSPEAAISQEIPKASSLKFMQVHTFYSCYLLHFYDANPHLAMAPFGEQLDNLIRDGFAGLHMFAPYLNHLGYESHLIIANNHHAQHQWLRENNLILDDPNDWMFGITRLQIDTLKPEILYMADPVCFDDRFIHSLSWRPKLILGWRAANIPDGIDWKAFDAILSHLSVCRRKALELGAKAVEHFFPGMPTFLAEAVNGEDKKYDVSFSGQWTQEHQKRNRFIELVGRASTRSEPHFSLALFIAADKPELLPSTVALFNRGPLWGMDMYHALKKSRIVINAESDLAQGEAGNMRLFEVTGIGSFLLTEYHPNICEYFEPGVEIETFRDEKDLTAKILYYLAHPDEREAIAKRGQQRCLHQYSMHIRAAEFDRVIRRYLTSRRQSLAPETKNEPI